MRRINSTPGYLEWYQLGELGTVTQSSSVFHGLDEEHRWRRGALDRRVRECLSEEAVAEHSEEQPCQDLGGQEKRGRKFQAGRTRAKVLKQEQAWLTQEAARKGGGDEVGGLLPEKLLPTSLGRRRAEDQEPREQVHQTSCREGNQLAPIVKGL